MINQLAMSFDICDLVTCDLVRVRQTSLSLDAQKSKVINFCTFFFFIYLSFKFVEKDFGDKNNCNESHVVK